MPDRVFYKTKTLWLSILKRVPLSTEQEGLGFDSPSQPVLLVATSSENGSPSAGLSPADSTATDASQVRSNHPPALLP